MRDGGCFIDGSRGGGAISSNEDAFFSLRFYLINLHCPGIDVCEDDQGIANVKKTDRVDKTNGTDKADKANKVDGANGTDRVTEQMEAEQMEMEQMGRTKQME